MIKFRNFLPLLFLTALFNNCSGQLNSSDKALTAASLANNFISLFPDTIAYKNEAKSYKWNYEQGLMYEAFYQMWKYTGDNKYFNYMKKNVDYYVEPNGSIKTYKLSDFNIDNVAPGRALIRLYAESKNEKYKKAADTLREQLRLQPRTEEGGFWHKKIYPYQMWLDGLYMGEPFYTMYSQLFNEPNFFDDIADQFIFSHNHLSDSITGLYYHGWDESKQQRWADPVTGRSPNFWGRSIGWYMMALIDVLDYFPIDHPKRNTLLEIFTKLSESLINFQDPKTKLWYQVMDKGNQTGNYLEASGSLMFIYSFAKGANKSYLGQKFYNIANESFHSVFEKFVTVDSKGLIYLNDICAGAGLGGNPYRDGSFEYYISEVKRTNDFKGYGAFILAAIEIEKGL